MRRISINLGNIAKDSLLAYILTCAFTSAFAISTFLSIPTLISVFISFLFIRNRSFLFNVTKINSLFLFWIVLTISFFFFSTGDKCFRHLIMWSISLFCFYHVIERSILKYSTDICYSKKILNTLSFIVFFASLFAILEFLLTNFAGVNVSDFIPRMAVVDYAPIALSTSIRARSFMEESGHFSFFLETLAPIAIGWILLSKKNKLFQLLYIAIIITSMILSFSAYGFLAIIIALLFFLYYYLFYSPNVNVILSRLSIVLLVISFLLVVFYPIVELFIDVISIKLDGSASIVDRKSRVDGIWAYLSGINLLIGYGPAAFDTLKVDSYISLYVGILMSTGIVGLLLFLFFLFKEYLNILKIENVILRCCFSIAFVTSVIHLCFIDLYYLPWFWIMLSLSSMVRLNCRNFINEIK